MGLPGGSAVKNLPTNTRDTGSVPGSGRSPGEGNGNLLQYSCWESPQTEEAGRLEPTESQESDMTDLVTRQQQQPSFSLVFFFFLSFSFLLIENMNNFKL